MRKYIVYIFLYWLYFDTKTATSESRRPCTNTESNLKGAILSALHMLNSFLTQTGQVQIRARPMRFTSCRFSIKIQPILKGTDNVFPHNECRLSSMMTRIAGNMFLRLVSTEFWLVYLAGKTEFRLLRLTSHASAHMCICST